MDNWRQEACESHPVPLCPLSKTLWPPPDSEVGFSPSGSDMYRSSVHQRRPRCIWPMVHLYTLDKRRSGTGRKMGCDLHLYQRQGSPIEVIELLDNSSFINALRRFFALWGPVKQIRSDRGTNFTNACKDPVKHLAEHGCYWISSSCLPHSRIGGGNSICVHYSHV